jgi:hypothetical protein
MIFYKLSVPDPNQSETWVLPNDLVIVYYINDKTVYPIGQANYEKYADPSLSHEKWIESIRRNYKQKARPIELKHLLRIIFAGKIEE